MKILHTADIHLGELVGPIKDGENARMLDTIKCMNYIERKALEEDVDVILIAGDLFNKSKLWADEMLREITIASNWLRSLASIAPTILMFGTANHDNSKAFENIKGMDIPWLTVVTEPELVKVNTKSGDIQIAAVPGVDKGYFRTQFPGMDMEDENKSISEALGNVILGISAEADTSTPLVLMSHYTVTGCTLENGESIFLNSDIVIPTAALAASNYDIVCLGHIHKAQSIPNCSRPVYYSGPPNAITFNEEGQSKGFWIHEIKDSVESRFVTTPSREFKTIKMDEFEISKFVKYGLDWFYEEDQEGATYFAPVKDKIVRVIYSCSDELNKQFSKKSLEKALYDAGAFYVSEIRPEKIITTTDKNAMSENDSVEDNLKLWLEKQEVLPDDIAKIIDIAKPMVTQISASLPTGKLTGVFEPLRLEVKNYRSYIEEEFDFTKVSFATVNGPNGIGKSSFFMDAIADCLYEEPREGELTGWISNAEDIKSGAMTFEFLMGADKWRVIRTRVKSGKSTLTLQKWHEDKWEDHSGDRKDQTQDKIINLLGMDALTFKSCALIMQDNYGVFLEADKTERMQVLSNILGLGIYDKLHDLAKEELKNKNREVIKLKDEIAELDVKLIDKNAQEGNLRVANEEKLIVSEALDKKENELKTTRKELEQLKDKESRITTLDGKINEISDLIVANEEEEKKLTAEKERAEKIVSKEDKILAKVKEYEEITKKITELKTKQPILTQKGTELREIKANVANIQNQISSKNKAIELIKEELANKNLLEHEIVRLTNLEVELKALDEDKVTYEKLTQKCKDLSQRINLLQSKFENEESRIKQLITDCKRKVELIQNSNCPVENPECSFLKDALEAKHKIIDLEEELNNIDTTELDKEKASYEECKKLHDTFKYSYQEHEEVRKKVESLRKKKEQLLGLSGKEELLNSYLQHKEELSNSLETFRQKSEILEMEVKKLTEELQQLDELDLSIIDLGRWYKGKDELPTAKELLRTANERLCAINTEIKKYKVNIENIKTEKDALCEEIAKIMISIADIETIESNIKRNNEELKNIEIAIALAESKLKELDELEADRDVKAKKIKKYANMTTNLTLLVKAFSIDGIPFQVVRSVVSELSSQSNEILSQMTGGKMAIEMKTDKVLKNKKEVNALEIWISDYQRGNMPYLSRSGGQKVKAALSVAFALADLKANRVGIQLSMMFIDEPPFLDAEGVQAYCDTLELMHTRYPNMRVIAISHDPAMKARFPQEIEVIDAGDKGSKILMN